jgi:hypothetical protein
VKRWLTIATVALAALLTACHDDDNPVPETAQEWSVNVVDQVASQPFILPWNATYESVTVSINGRTAKTRSVVVTAADDWLEVSSERLAPDDIVALKVKANDTNHLRKTTLTFTDADNPMLTASLEVSQRAKGMTNGEDACSDLYVGYGYDIYKALESTMAVRTKAPVLLMSLMRQYSMSSDYQLLQDCRLARTNVRYVSSTDIHAFGRDLSELQTGDADHHFEGCREECLTAEKLLQTSNGTFEQQNYGHGSLEKIVASRVIDRGALRDLKSSGYMPYSTPFVLALSTAREQQGEQRAKQIERILTEFGTHVVVQVDLGGRIDYTFTMQKSASFNSAAEMRQEVEYTMGRMTANERVGKNLTVSSSKSGSGAITVKGGSEEARRQLEQDISALSNSGQIEPLHITDWMASINYSPDLADDASLEVIHFELIPLWDIVPEDVRLDFMEATFRMGQRSDCSLPASFTGTDIYEIDASQDDLFDFSACGADNSLCRLLYMDGEPVLQVCSEYVPKIRTDQRVTVVYPIYKQHIRMNQGLFLGDGIHQPAFVGFSGADCYVNPIYDLTPGVRIDRFYYVNGNLMLDNPTNVDGLNGKGRTVSDDVMRFRYAGINYRHPIVKVGANFWTRRDLNHGMGLTNNPNGSNARTYDMMVDDVLYARYWHDLGRTSRPANSWQWGYEPNTYYSDNPNTKWYFPTGTEVNHLYAFLGFNPKALFRGQVSGYEAQFNGYYGGYDIATRQTTEEVKQRDKGELNVFATRNTATDGDALLLVLDKEYRFYKAENGPAGSWRENYYPVRAARGYMYVYPQLQDISEYEEKY